MMDTVYPSYENDSHSARERAYQVQSSVERVGHPASTPIKPKSITDLQLQHIKKNEGVNQIENIQDDPRCH
jgi:hypothetical protein